MSINSSAKKMECGTFTPQLCCITFAQRDSVLKKCNYFIYMIKNLLFMKYKSKLMHIFIALAMVAFSVNLYAQNRITVNGSVLDSNGEALIGVTVLEKGLPQNAVPSDFNGNFSITAGSNSTLVFSYLGYGTQEVSVNGRTNIHIVMKEETLGLDEVVVVGYGVQKKVTLSGAVSALKGDAIVVTKNENVQNMLTGKIPGVRVWQRSSEPGAFDSRFDIRGLGTPLVVIDGVMKTMEEFQRLSPNDIEDISVLKDGSAAIYGLRSSAGVVLVTTKKGQVGKTEVSYSGSYSMQFPSGLPNVVNAEEYMTIMNWNDQRRKTGEINLRYSEKDFEDFRTGVRKDWNWNEYILQPWSPETQHSVSIRGGNDRSKFYVSTGYMYQNSFFKGNDRNYNKYNVLSNLQVNIFKNLTFDLSLSAIVDERNQPAESAVWTIRDYWRMNPIIGPYADLEETMLNQNVTETENPLSMIYSDYIGSEQRQRKWFDLTGSLKYDLPWIKGLNIKGLFGQKYNFENFRRHNKLLHQYSHNPTTNEYTEGTASRYNVDRFRHEQYLRTQRIMQLVANYNGKFGLSDIAATLGWEAMWREGDNLYAQRELLFPRGTLSSGTAANQQGSMSTGNNDYYFQNSNALIGRLNYSFANKYLAEFIFRYDGSSMYHPEYQWGFFPGVSVAWRLSEEEFFRNLFPSVQQLKLRASYGETGNDDASRYEFMEGYNYPVSNNSREFSSGYVFNGGWIGSVANRGIANKYLTWTRSKIANYGVDFEAWNGLFGFSLDYFDRRLEGIPTRRTGGIPTVIGATIPQENLNSTRHFGLELELTHRQQINDLRYRVSLMGSITRFQRLHWDERTFNSSRDRWINGNANRLNGVGNGGSIWFTQREANGQFMSWEEIWNNPVQEGTSMLPGGYRYLDWNGDGEISSYDNHPLFFNNNTPWVNFSLNLEAQYKRFDLTALFQGSAFGSVQYGEQLRGDSETLKALLNRWHPTDPTADPYDPKTQWTTGYYAFSPQPDANSSWNVVDNSYLRLKNIELGYNLPKYNNLNTRIFIGGYNVFTISKVRNIDPESPGASESWGFMYPLNKTLTFGLTVKF